MPDDVLYVEFRCSSKSIAERIGFLLLGEIHYILSGPRTGRYYPVPGNYRYDDSTPVKARGRNFDVRWIGTLDRTDIDGASYQASAPGEAPAVRTGRLRQSFFMEITLDGFSGMYICKVSTNVYYADDLEFGTKKMAARPFLQPSVDKVIKALDAMELAHVQDVISTMKNHVSHIGYHE